MSPRSDFCDSLERSAFVSVRDKKFLVISNVSADDLKSDNERDSCINTPHYQEEEEAERSRKKPHE